MKMIEFTSKFRTGTGFITGRTCMAVRNIQFIRETPPEMPEYADGMVSQVADMIGISYSTENYDSLSKRYADLMENEA